MLNRIREWFKDRRIERAQRDERRRIARLRSRPCLEALEERAVPSVKATDTFEWLPGQVGGPNNQNWSADHFNTNLNKWVSNWWDVTTGTGTGTALGDTIPGASSSVVFDNVLSGSDANCNTDATITVKNLTIANSYTHSLNVVTAKPLSASGATVLNGGTGSQLNLSANYSSNGGLTWTGGLVNGTAILRLSGGSPNWIGGTKIAGVVTLDSNDPELATQCVATTASSTTYIGFYSEGHNFKLDSGALFDILKGTVVLCQDQAHDGAGNNGTSGGITGALGTVEVSAGGTLRRDLFARSNGDTPNITAVKIVSPLQTDFFTGFSNGQLTVADSMGLETDGTFTNSGTLTLTGGSVFTASGGFHQEGNNAITNMAYGTYNLQYNTELAVSTAYFDAGVLDLSLNSAGKYGTFYVVALPGGGGNVQIGDSVGGTTCTVDLYYKDSTNNSTFNIAGSLTFSAATGSENSINLTWQSASGHNSTGWLPIVYASTNANPGVNEAVQFFGYPFAPTATWFDSGSNHFLKVTW